MNEYYVYIMTNKIMTNKSGTLYTGVTNNIQRRVFEHRNKKGLPLTKQMMPIAATKHQDGERLSVARPRQSAGSG